MRHCNKAVRVVGTRTHIRVWPMVGPVSDLDHRHELSAWLPERAIERWPGLHDGFGVSKKERSSCDLSLFINALDCFEERIKENTRINLFGREDVKTSKVYAIIPEEIKIKIA